ncbi:hypothetical protein QBC43DRAFT_316844 [Cladorrhinum sp. PSN259]|nr:hypothetical protein QBC43DRAFT_316844 [Cladorrhinum sp. PSN259]
MLLSAPCGGHGGSRGCSGAHRPRASQFFPRLFSGLIASIPKWSNQQQNRGPGRGPQGRTGVAEKESVDRVDGVAANEMCSAVCEWSSRKWMAGARRRFNFQRDRDRGGSEQRRDATHTISTSDSSLMLSRFNERFLLSYWTRSLAIHSRWGCFAADTYSCAPPGSYWQRLARNCLRWSPKQKRVGARCGSCCTLPGVPGRACRWHLAIAEMSTMRWHLVRTLQVEMGHTPP